MSCPNSQTASVTNVGVQILLHLMEKSGTDLMETGLFLSPVSIFCALMLTLNGAGQDSDTYNQILKFLTPSNSSAGLQAENELNEGISGLLGQFSNLPPQSTAELSVANSIFSRAINILPEYTQSMSSLFQATASEVKSADDINAWVSNATRGHIRELVPAGMPFDIVLANAVYFKGQWEERFDPARTQLGAFKTLSGNTKQVSMMSATFKRGSSIRYTMSEKYVAVRMMYQGGQFAAVAILPAENCTPADALKAWFDPSVPQKFTSAGSPDVILTMPKFKVESETSLGKVLQSMGVRAAFVPGEANFSRLTDAAVQVDDVIHKAVTEVDEQGTVAAAATAVFMNPAFSMPRHLAFDRPFLFSVTHVPSGAYLFIGIVANP